MTTLEMPRYMADCPACGEAVTEYERITEAAGVEPDSSGLIVRTHRVPAGFVVHPCGDHVAEFTIHRV